MNNSVPFLCIRLGRTLPLSVVGLLALPLATWANSPAASTVVSTPGVESAAPSAVTLPATTATPTSITPAASTPVVTPASASTITPAAATTPQPYWANAPVMNYPTGAPVYYPVAQPPQMVYPSALPVQNGYPGYAMPAAQTPPVSVQVVVGAPGQAAMPIYAPGVTPPVPYPGGVPVTYPGGTPMVGYPTVPAPVPMPSLPSQYGNPAGWANTANSPWAQKVLEADRLYQMGQTAQAERLYQEALAMIQTNLTPTSGSNTITSPVQLPPAAQQLWQTVMGAANTRLNSTNLTALQQLVQAYPQFIPGQLQLAQALETAGRRNEAIALLSTAMARFPNQPELAQTQVSLLQRAGQWMDAAIAARQFALMNPNSSLSADFVKQADDLLKRAQGSTNSTKPNLVGTLVRGVLGRVLTDNVLPGVLSRTSGAKQPPLSQTILQGVLGSFGGQSSTGGTSSLLGILDLLRSKR